MSQKLFGGFILILLTGLIITACNTKDGKLLFDKESKATEKKVQDKSKDAKGTEKMGKKSDSKDFISPSNVELIYGPHFESYTISEFLKKGAGIFLNSKKSCFDVAELIKHAKDPRQVTIDTKGFESFCVNDFTVKGAKILVSSKYFSTFDIQSFINAAKDKSIVTVIASEGFCSDILGYLKSGARIKINKKQEPFKVLSYIDTGKERVEIYVEGFTPNWVMSFIKRGASIYADNHFSDYKLFEFGKAGKERVKVYGKKLSISTIEKILSTGAKVTLGKFPKLNGKLFTGFEISNLIKKFPDRITVIADGFKAHEIANFIALGGKIIFWDYARLCNINSFINKVPPPTEPALSE